MKKAFIGALCAVASLAFVSVAGAGDLCYRFHSVTNNNNPYPTDSFRINYGAGRAIGTGSFASAEMDARAALALEATKMSSS